MNGYICFYNDKRIEVHADSMYAAQEKAVAEFQKMFPRRKVKGFQVNTNLAELAGETVTHVAVN